jgi:hypothetical protein
LEGTLYPQYAFHKRGGINILHLLPKSGRDIFQTIIVQQIRTRTLIPPMLVMGAHPPVDFHFTTYQLTVFSVLQVLWAIFVQYPEIPYSTVSH